MWDGNLLRWLRDFTLFGAGIGSVAPLVVLGPMMWGSGDPVLGVVAVSCALGGALVGTLVGVALYALTVVGHRHPFVIGLAGFPIGATAGWMVGTPIGTAIGHDADLFIGTLGMVTGGLVLGFTWLPYLALKLVDRSGLPVVALGVLGSPVMGAVAFGTVLVLGL